MRFPTPPKRNRLERSALLRKRRAGYQSLWFSFKMLSALLVKLLLQTALSSHPLLSAHQIPGQEDQAQGSSVVEVLFDHQIGSLQKPSEVLTLDFHQTTNAQSGGLWIVHCVL